MSRRRLEKQVGAYRDGALSAQEADLLLRRLELDPEAKLELARHEALGRLTREAWREGPAGPSPERLIANLRAGMRRIDAELEEASPKSWRGWLAPSPLVAVGAAALLLALAIVQPESMREPARGGESALTARAAMTGDPVPAERVSTRSEPEREIPVYDLAQGESPLMLFEDQGTTFIWLLEPEKLGDDVSALPGGWA